MRSAVLAEDGGMQLGTIGGRAHRRSRRASFFGALGPAAAFRETAVIPGPFGASLVSSPSVSGYTRTFGAPPGAIRGGETMGRCLAALAIILAFAQFAAATPFPVTIDPAQSS